MRKSDTSEYHSWQAMNRRCYNPHYRAYHNYGGRGISVYDEWRYSFDAFLEHMGPKPTPRHTLERIDTNGNYVPGNVRWATQKEQMRNTRRTVYVTAFGKTKSCCDWAEEFNVDPDLLRYRVKRGWDHERALQAPRHRWEDPNRWM